MIEISVLKGSFRWRHFFHFWLTEIKQVKLVQFFWVGVWLPPNKKKNERTLIKYLKTFQAQFLHSVKTYLIVKPVQGQVFAGKLTIFYVYKWEVEVILFVFSDQPPRPGGARLWLSVRPEEYSDPSTSTSTSTSSLPPSLPPSLSLSLSLPCKFNFPNIDNFVPYFS